MSDEEEDDPFALDDDDDAEDDPFACDDCDDDNINDNDTEDDPFACGDDDDVDEDPYEEKDTCEDDVDQETKTSLTFADETSSYLQITPHDQIDFVRRCLEKHRRLFNLIYHEAIRKRAENVFESNLDKYKLDDMNRRLNLPTQSERQVMDFSGCSKQDARQALEMCNGDVNNAVNLFLQGILTRSHSPAGAAPERLSLVSISTETMNKKRKDELLDEQKRLFTARWKHVLTSLSKESCEFLLRDGTKIIWEQLLLSKEENTKALDQRLNRLNDFVNNIHTCKKKDFLVQLLKPSSLPWLWRQVERGDTSSQFLDHILTHKTPCAEHTFKFAQVEICSEEVSSEDISNLCSNMNHFAVSLSPDSSYVVGNIKNGSVFFSILSHFHDVFSLLYQVRDHQWRKEQERCE